jgi:hypothetical protein
VGLQSQTYRVPFLVHQPPFWHLQGSFCKAPPVLGLVLLTHMTLLDAAVVSALHTGAALPRDKHW